MVDTTGNYKYKWGKRFGRWKIVENSTGYNLSLCASKKKGIMLANYLNAGGGFNGTTPYFFIDKTIQEEQ